LRKALFLFRFDGGGDRQFDREAATNGEDLTTCLIRNCRLLSPNKLVACALHFEQLPKETGRGKTSVCPAIRRLN